MLKWKLFRSPVLAISWLVFISILFFLPGSSFPKNNWFAKIYLDKWVHVGVFAVLLFLVCAAFNRRRNRSVLFVIAGAVYGLLVEIIQKEWVPRRGFDVYDLLADIVGAMAGAAVWWRVYKKNKPL